MTQIKVFAGSENDAKEINPHPFLDLLKRPAPNMEWLEDYRKLREQGSLEAGSNLPELVGRRRIGREQRG